MNKLQLARNLMLCTILLVSGFLCYWVKKLYSEEYDALRKKTDVLLKESVQQIQGERFKSIKEFVNPADISRVDIRKDSSTGATGMAIITQKMLARIGGQQPEKPVKHVLPKKIHHDTTRSGPAINNQELQEKLDSILKKTGHVGNGSVRIIMRGADLGKDTLTVSSSGTPKMSFISQYKTVTEDGVVKADTTVMLKPIEGRVEGVSISANARPGRIMIDTLSQAKKFFIQINTLNDTIPVAKLDSHYRVLLNKEAIPLHYTILSGKFKTRKIDSIPDVKKLATSYVFGGFSNTIAYSAIFDSPFTYIAKKLALPASFALLLITITIVSFVVLYKSLLSQKRLAEMKNDFISNITHELKTPIATVNVAIEALRNFDVIDNPQRTREYLDISAIELQRLSLLVDKVLRLSMFEHKETELQLEHLDIKQLLQEIVNTMRLQFQKAKANVAMQFNGADFTARADRLHMMSVIYNLLDNAVKYSKENPHINIVLSEDADNITLSVQDNGIGISTKYRDKIFDKFFRVPTNDRHNVKGYGLGLSYVSNIIHQHNGNIAVESEEGKGSTFIVQIPKQHE